MSEKTHAPVGKASPHEPARSTQAASKRKQAKILAFVNQKGGTGKTTTAQNLAVCLALHHDKRVLCIDLDPQGNFGQGLLPDPISTTKTADRLLMVPKANVAEYIIPIRPGVDLIPNRYQRELHEAVDSLPLSANVLRKQLSPVLARYDFILVDTPAGLCRSTQIGVDAADQVVIVISCGRYALQGTVSMIDWIGEICAKLCKRMPAVKVLLNNFNERRRFDREFKQEVEYIFGDDLYQTQIRPSIRIVEAAAQGLSVIEYTQLSPGVTDFKRLSREMLGLPISVAMPANVMAEHEPQQKKGVLQFIS